MALDNIVQRFLLKAGITNLDDFQGSTFTTMNYDKANETMFISWHFKKPLTYELFELINRKTKILADNGVFISEIDYSYDVPPTERELLTFIMKRLDDFRIPKLDIASLDMKVNGNTVVFHFVSSWKMTAFKEFIKFINDDLQKINFNYSIVSQFTEVALEEDTEKEEEKQKAIIEASEQFLNMMKREKSNNSAYQETSLHNIDGLTNIQVDVDIFGVERKETTSKKTQKQFIIYTFKVTDYTDSIVMSVFCNKTFTDEFLKTLTVGTRITVKGTLELGYNSTELELKPKKITIIPNLPKRTDEAKNKRVELHVHTKMSAMDGVSSITEYLKAASNFHHTAIGLTDHGSVQSYPEVKIAQFDPELAKIKVLYGTELYMVDEELHYIQNPSDRILEKEKYVVFDLETTGLSARYDEIIEFGAIKYRHGMMEERMDLLINPGIEIKPFTTELTGITPDMLKGAPTIKEALQIIKAYISDSILISHNADFDIGFLSAAFKKNGFEEIKNPVIDTLSLSRYFYPESRSHTLGALCRLLEVDYDEVSAHRADYDAMVLSRAWQAMLVNLVSINKDYRHQDLSELRSLEVTKLDRPKHITVFPKSQLGLKELFQIISASHITYFNNIPKTPRRLLLEHREDLLLGSSCFNGEVFQAALTRTQEVLEEKMKFYDFIEVQPLSCYSFLINDGQVASNAELIQIIKDIIASAHKLGIPVVATGDCHYVEPEEKIFRDVYISAKAVKGNRHPLNPYRREKQNYENPDQHYLTTSEMLDAFYFLPTDVAEEIVITNTNMIANLLPTLKPIHEKLYTPTIPGCDKELIQMVYDKAHRWYGPVLPELIEERLKAELKGIGDNNYYVIYYIASKIVTRANSEGYIVGSRGSVGSSFVATMADITEVNALPPHYRCPNCQHFELSEDKNIRSGFDLPDKVCPKCGTKMIQDGQNIPFATFLGFHAEKVPDIDLNFGSDYQAKAHNLTKELLGENNVFRAGTISTVAEKTAFGYVLGYLERMGIPADSMRRVEKERIALGCQDVKKTTGQHPGGIIVIPGDMDVSDFTPIQYPADDMNASWKTTHLDFHAIHDNVLKLDLLGHVDPYALKLMSDLLGCKVEDIPINDSKVISLFSSPKELHLKHNYYKEKTGALAIPEFGTSFVRQLLSETNPKTFGDLLIISGLSHGTDVWNGNAEELITKGTCTLQEVIGCRDDIMIDLASNWGLDPAKAFKIMEAVRKGKGLSPENEAYMNEHHVPKYYMDSCRKIKYLFPKGHAVAYCMMGMRVGWFKVYHPLVFYAVFFSVRSDQYDLKTMIAGETAIYKRLQEIDNNKLKGKLDKKEIDIQSTLTIALEMTDRGYKFENVNLYKSQATMFVPDEEHNSIIPPFTAIDGFGPNAAQSVMEESKLKPFLSIEDLQKRTKVTKQNIEVLKEMGVLDGLPLSNQMTLFDF